MTQPPVTNAPMVQGPGGTDEQALDQFAQIVTGNKNLVSRPNLVSDLASSGAGPAQAAAVDSMVGALEAQNALQQLRATNQKVALPSYMRASLDSIGADYSDVNITQQQQTQNEVAAIAKQGMVPVYDNLGNLVGARAKTQQESNQGKPGWFSSPGGFFHHLLHNPVSNVVGEAGNVTQETVGDLFQSHSQFEETAQLMRSMGYDPGSQLSQIAFAAKGYVRSNISGLVDQFGQDQVNQAEQYLANPDTYVSNLRASSYAKDPTGAAFTQSMAQLDSENFGKLLRSMGAKQAGLGSDLATSLGIDPLKHPTLYGSIAGGTNFVASFFTDPTIVLGKTFQLAKMASVGIEGMSDTSRIARILDVANGNVFARSIQRGFHSAVDSGNTIREANEAMAAAHAAGDLKAYADAEAKAAGGYAALHKVGLQELAPALVGTHRVTGLAEDGTLLTEAGGEPLDTYDKLFQYVTNTRGMMALQAGKAAVESTLMPGALSRFGASFVRDALSGVTQSRRAAYSFKRLEAATRLLPTPVDAEEVATAEHLSQTAVDNADQVAKQVATLSPSEVVERAFPSDAQLGEADYNLRRYGNFSGTGIGGLLGKALPLPAKVTAKLGDITPGSWINPFAVAARARLASRRLNVFNVLPRNNTINLLDEQAPAQVLAFAKTYLPITQASMLASSFASADIGARRAILQGVKTQVLHAAGLFHSEAGSEFANKLLDEDRQIYSHSIDGNMDQDPWTGGFDVPSALWGAQNRVTYSIPSFPRVHSLAAKIGFHEAILGRMMTNNVADSIGRTIRTSMLLTPRTANRATVEGWVNMLARGDARKALATKAVLSNLDMLPERTKIMTKATGWFLPKAVGDLVKNVEKRGLTDDEVEFLHRIHDNYPDVAKAIQDSLSDHLMKGDINPASSSHDALEIAQTGYKPVQYEDKGWLPQSTAGYEGAHRLEQALKLREKGNPETFKAALNYIADPSEENHLRILDAMKTPDEYNQFRRMRWTHVYDNGTGTGTLQRAVTEEEREVALQQHSVRMVNDLRTLMTGQNGELHQGLLDKLRGSDEVPGELPDAEWINENLKGEARPESAIAPSFAPKVVDDKDGIAEAMDKIGKAVQDLSGKAYKAIVTRPAERMTSMPSFWRNYVRERMNMRNLESSLVDEGLTPEAADQLVMMRGIRGAWQRTEYTVDDPGLKTQLDVVGRNFFAFPRAVNAFIRRYGELVRQDPTVIRKAILGIQGAEQSGVLYRDQNGELTYTVPGSNFLVNSLNEFARHVGWEGMLLLPSGDITGKLLMSAPGFDNPVRPSMSPMLNIPFRFIANMFPDHREMLSEIDNVLNGSKGANRTVQSTLMPAMVSHFWEALDPHERNNMIASSFIGAFSNVVAADPNGERGIMPKPGSDPTGVQMNKVMGTIKTQVRNQLFMRAMLGLVLPGAPSRPSDHTDGSVPDEAYFIRGARSLSDEYKMMVNDFGGDYAAAQQAFVTEHPNGLIYTVPTSTINGADVPATRSGEQWMEKNFDLLQKYPQVAAYFAPPSKGRFDANAWSSQLALGIRQKDSIKEFVNAWELKQSQQGYYAAYDQMKAARDAAIAGGSKRRAAYLTADFNQQMQPFFAANPVLKDWLTLGDAQKASQATHALAQLRAIVTDPSAAKLDNLEPARGMLSAWDAHESFQNNQVANTAAARNYEDTQFGHYMEGLLVSNPSLAGLYDMFRAMDYKSLPSLTALSTAAQAAPTTTTGG